MTDAPRLRPHPQERFDTPALRFDLATAARHLRAEPHPPVTGHRQIALYKFGPVELILFAFDEGGELQEHRVDAVVVMHVVRGRLAVTLDGERHELTDGQVLTLAPGVAQSVRALASSDMLLSVYQQHG